LESAPKQQPFHQSSNRFTRAATVSPEQ
jgi:hypothetical protein